MPSARPIPHRFSRRVTVSAVLGLALLLNVQGEGASAAAARPGPHKPLAPALEQRKQTSVDVTTIKARPGAPDLDRQREVTSAPAPQWPAPGRADVSVPQPAATPTDYSGLVTGRPSRPVAPLAKAGALPVSIGPSTTANRTATAGRSVADSPSKVQVNLLGRRGNQLLVRLDRTDRASARGGQVSLQVDYSSFRHAFGGDWNRRLRIVQLPDCAAATPTKANCGPGTALATRNDGVGALTADVPATGLFAVQAAAAGDSGDSTKTSLSETATWQAGGQSGDFNWNYPIKTPPGLGDAPTPDLKLGYSSGSVDGRTSSANSQASWVGAGFELTPGGSIERRYASCGSKTEQKGNNGTSPTGDLCWGTDNATFSLNGAGGELVKDDVTGVFHPRNDDGMKVERKFGALNDDLGPAENVAGGKGEYWVITDRSGTKFYFGLNKLPGNTSPSQDTNSAWTVPVFGNNASEPCNKATFAASSCDQAYRWNLDYVVDTQGNTMSLFYSKETNNYARNVTAGSVSKYTRAGNVLRIEYGQADGRVFLDKAVAVVDFTTDNRCYQGSTCTPSDYPDTPLDQECTSTTNCDNHFYPSFWTKKRLAKVTTSVLRGTTYQQVASWNFRQTYLDPKDTRSPMLWLEGITNTGLVGGALATPEVTFAAKMMANRVVGADGLPAMNWPRVDSITYGTGGQLTVGYLGAECSLPGNVPTPDTNDKRCHQIRWTPPNQAERPDWFNKYVVSTVTESDLSTGLDPVTTTVKYLTPPAWHHDDEDGLVEVDNKTWSQWRGYEKVEVTKGSGPAAVVTRNTYFRGMYGDLKKDGSTKTTQITDSTGAVLNDEAPLSGTMREQATISAGAVVSRSITDSWISPATSSRKIDERITKAFIVQQGVVRDEQATGSGWRRSTSSNTYAANGSVLTTYDSKNVDDTTDDETCSRYTYVSNPAKGIIDLPTDKQVTTGTCATPPSQATTISHDRTTYDTGVPTAGNKTRAERLSGYDANGKEVFQTVATTTYDAQGRVRSTTDANGKTTSFTLTPATGPVTKTSTTLPTGLTSSTLLDPAWGEEVTAIDQAGRQTDTIRDPLGRVTSTYKPGDDRAGTPSTKVSYTTGTDKPNVVTTQTRATDGTVSISYDLLDGLMRKRQTQQPAAGGDGRVITDYQYDARGLEVQEDGPYFNSAPPGTTVVKPSDPSKLPSRKTTQYDDRGRPTVETVFSLGQILRKTTRTSATGVETIDPPEGEQATTTFTDVDGRTTELRKYRGSDPTGPSDSTLYAYNKAGKLTKVTDPAGNVWTMEYDLRGRLVKQNEPDKGESTFGYDDKDQLISTKDARGVTLQYTYDASGRKTGVSNGSTKLAEWTWDTVKPGSLSSSTRYVDGAAYRTANTGFDDAGRPTGSEITIPAKEGLLGKTYRTSMTYTRDGRLDTTKVPEVGGLPEETLKIEYDEQGLPSSLTGADTYIRGTIYTPYQEVETLAMGRGDNWIQQSFEYEEGTHRLSRADVLTPDGHASDVHYSYDAAGNVTKVSDAPDAANPALTDTQCFTYDGYRRLTQAWTPKDSNCSATPSKDTLGGPAPYLQSWTFDVTGNRKTASSTTPAGTTTSTYTYPALGEARPHAVQKVSVKGPDGSTTDTTFGYDARGNRTTRSGETYTWDAEGHVNTVTSGAKKTSFLYDADGNRLLRRDASGTTLYMGDTEVLLSADKSSVTGTRYYSTGGPAVAVRTGSTKLTWLTTDHHGTTNVTIDADTMAVQRRYSTPYGESRGTKPTTWATNRGFVGGTEDASTGLTHLGAREYDPGLGQFVSGDPVVDFGDPQQLNAYAYANNSPVTFSDANGQRYVYDVVKQLKATIKTITKRVVEYRKEVVHLTVSAGLFAIASMMATVFHNYALAAWYRSQAVKTIVRIRQIVHIVHELVRVMEEISKTVKRWVPDRAQEIDKAMNGLRNAAAEVNRAAQAANALAAAFALNDGEVRGGGGAAAGGLPGTGPPVIANPFGQNESSDMNWDVFWTVAEPLAELGLLACLPSFGIGCGVAAGVVVAGPILVAAYNCANGPQGFAWGQCFSSVGSAIGRLWDKVWEKPAKPTPTPTCIQGKYYGFYGKC